MAGSVRVAMWSGPRNISTAMMRSWSSRGDCTVLDEPFYGAYLATTGLDHPMRDEILARHETGWQACADACAADGPRPVVFQKHMCQHMIAEAPRDWMAACRHAFLIRPPEEVVPSFARGWQGLRPVDLGFEAQAALFDHVRALTGRVPPVISAAQVLADPRRALQALCAALELPFDPAMLSWPAGPHPADGAWAPHWYGRVNASTGFAPAPADPPPPPPAALVPLIDACRPHFARLQAELLEI